MSNVRWIYSTAGSPTYYQDDGYIYSKDGRCEFSVSDGWWYSIKDGKASYYIANDYVYFPNGKPAFYYDTRH